MNKKFYKSYNFLNLAILFPSILLVALLFIVPLIVLFVISLTGSHFGSAYEYLFDNISIINLIFHSLLLSLYTMLFSIFIGYPIALWMYKIDGTFSIKVVLVLIIMPFFLNSLIKILCVRAFLIPLHLLGTDFALVIGLTYLYVPFMIVTLYNSLTTINREIIESSYDLGASKIQTFIKIIFPLSLSGLITGSALVFLPCITTVIVPFFLGNSHNFTIGNYLIDIFTSSNNSLPIIAAVSFIAMFIIFLLVMFFKVIRYYLTYSQRKIYDI